MAKGSTARLSIREQILSKSLKLFISRGFHGLSLAELSRAIKISKPAIIYHFPKPEDVFIELMNRWAASGAGVVSAYLSKHMGESPDKMLVRTIEANLAWLDQESDFGKLSLAVFLASQTEPKIKRKLDELFAAGRERIKRLLEMGSDIKSEKELVAVAFYLHSLIVGAIVSSLLLSPDSKNKDDLRLSQIEGFKKIISNYV